MNDWNYKPVVEVAKIVRKVLKEAYPDTKFSVRCHKYAGGASIDVRWLDGPTQKQVDAKVRYLQSWDYMDITDYMHTKKSTHEGETFHSGANSVSCQRDHSIELMERAAREMAERYDLPPLEIATWGDGRGYIANGQEQLMNTRINEGPEYWYGQAVQRRAYEISDVVEVHCEICNKVYQPEDYDGPDDANEAFRQDHQVEASVNEILEHEADNPVEFEPNEIDAALQGRHVKRTEVK